MIKTSLFADQERAAQPNKLGDALRVMERRMHGRWQQTGSDSVFRWNILAS